MTDPDFTASEQNIPSTNLAGVEKAWYGDDDLLPFLSLALTPQTPHPNVRQFIRLSKIQKITKSRILWILNEVLIFTLFETFCVLLKSL